MEFIPKEQFLPAGENFNIPEPARPAPKGFAADAWSRFRKNRSSVVAGFIILGLLLFAILLLYVLAAMIRLAWFNVTEEERQRTEGGVRKYYTGLPVTSAALIFPVVMLAQYLSVADISLFYIAVALLTGLAFVSKVQVPKPGLRGILAMIAVGLVIVAVMVVLMLTTSSTLSFFSIFISH